MTHDTEELAMRTILMTTALAVLLPGMAAAMPLAPAMPRTAAVIQVQGLPGYYRWDPCMPGAPPVRTTIIDAVSGQPVETHVPAASFCRSMGRDVYRAPPRRFDDDREVYRGPPRRFDDDRSVYRTGPRYYDERPVYRERPRFYDDDRPVFRERRPPPPGWERDPYTGRDMRILR